jgi:hypothetical protein
MILDEKLVMIHFLKPRMTPQVQLQLPWKTMKTHVQN